MEILLAAQNERRVNWSISPTRTKAGRATVFGEPDVERLWTRSRPPPASTSPTRSRPGKRTSTGSRARDAAQRAQLRRAPLPRPGHRPHRRPDRERPLAHRRRGDARRPAPRRQHADRGGLYDPAPPPHRRGPCAHAAARRRRHDRPRPRGALRGRPCRRGVRRAPTSCVRQLAIDDGAPLLGEVALVDGDSRVGRTGLVFLNTLFDENATCHIAYGGGSLRRSGHES